MSGKHIYEIVQSINIFLPVFKMLQNQVNRDEMGAIVHNNLEQVDNCPKVPKNNTLSDN